MSLLRIDDPTVRPLFIPINATGGTGSGTGATNSGVAVFATPGVGAGFDFVDIVFAVAMADATYMVSLTAAAATDSIAPPPVAYDLAHKTANGFRITPQQQFAGEVSWAVFPRTQ